LAASPNFLDHKFGNPERRMRRVVLHALRRFLWLRCEVELTPPERLHQRHFKVVFDPVATLLLRMAIFRPQNGKK
jgi:hypothetical protein